MTAGPGRDSEDALIRLTGAGVRYRTGKGLRDRGWFWPLRGIDLAVMPGETLGVIGRNGAGKSTLLQLLAGVIAPDEGRIGGAARHVSLLALQAGFIPHLSGRDNALLSGMLLGFPRRQVERLLPEIVGFAELGRFIDQPVRTYSAGMRARLGFSVALQLDPDVLLVDEVLGVGDAAFQRKSTEAMKAKIRSRRTVVLVSHSLPVLRELCDRVMWLADGAVRMEGRPEKVLAAYAAAVSANRPAALPAGAAAAAGAE